MSPEKRFADLKGLPPVTEPAEQLADLRALHRDLGRLRARAARMIAEAEGRPKPNAILDECRAVLDLIPTTPGVMPIDAWRHCDDGDPDAPDRRTFRRSIAAHTAWVFEGERVLADVIVVGVQEVTLRRDGDGWELERISLDDWSVQVAVESGLSSARAHELAAAVNEAATFCAKLEPEDLLAADELAARRNRR